MNKALIIFIKNPEAGKVKTRLAKTIGEEKAFCVYQKLLLHTNKIVRKVSADKFVFYSSFINQNDEWDSLAFSKQLQQGSHLGERMANAFKSIIAEGYKNSCIIGSDCPELTSALIEQAFTELKNTNVVIGPAIDGGYYLLGLKNFHRKIFEEISWSTNKVLSQTIDALDKLNLSFFLLPRLSDVDVEDDLKGFEEKLIALKPEE